jgi:hypothetical protein
METLNDDLYRLLLEVLTQLPSLLTMAVCIVVAIVRWKRHPRASLIVILALTFLSLGSLVFSAIFIWIPKLFVSLENPDSVQVGYTIMQVIYNLLFTLALGALILAVFTKRSSFQSS